MVFEHSFGSLVDVPRSPVSNVKVLPPKHFVVRLGHPEFQPGWSRWVDGEFWQVVEDVAEDVECVMDGWERVVVVWDEEFAMHCALGLGDM